jgi:hypothetical protein
LRRKCPLKHIIEGKIEGMGRRGRISTQLLDDIKEKRKYWNLHRKTLIFLCGNSFLKRLWTYSKAGNVMYERKKEKRVNE